MNAAIGCDSNGFWSNLGTDNDELPTNDHGSRLLRLSQECQLFIMNSIYHSTTPHRHTWYSPAWFTKRVFYILTVWHKKQLSTNCRVYRRASILFESDHRFLALPCSFPSKHQQKLFFCHPKGPKSYTNITLLKNNPKVSELFSKTLDNLLQNDPKIDDINTFEQSLRESILNAIDTAIPKCITASRITPWINEDSF